MRRCILNVAVNKGGGHGAEWYERAQSRLAKSLLDIGETAEPMFWRGMYPHLSPTHQQIPFAFKPYAFAYALMQGYDQAIWFDACIQASGPLDEIWNLVNAQGYCLSAEGFTVGQWANDKSLEIMGLTRREALEIPLMGGNVMAFDLRHPLSKRFLSQWIDYAEKGAFNGDVKDHRHDITVGGVIAHRLGMELTPGLVTMNKNPALLIASSG